LDCVIISFFTHLSGEEPNKDGVMIKVQFFEWSPIVDWMRGELEGFFGDAVNSREFSQSDLIDTLSNSSNYKRKRY